MRRSLAFNGYVDTTLDVERDMTKRLVESDALSEEENEVPTLGNGVLRERGPTLGVGTPFTYLSSTQRF